MGLFEDVSRFLEDRLEEFLRKHPHLEIEALEEQLREQEEDTLRLIAELQREEKRLQDDILSIAQDIQRWNSRVKKAEQSNRQDLVQAAKEREASLLRQGNQCWGQMEGVKKRTVQAKELYYQVQQRRKEVQAKAAQMRTERAKAQTTTDSETIGWNKAPNYSTATSGFDPLDEQFRRWEAEDELEQMKRNLGKS
ncbi:MAG: TIGR04376 family protein [Cyanobacteriota bacterium]